MEVVTMIKPKILLDDSIRAFILSERKRTHYSAEFVSEKIGRSKSWLAQIENGRTKTINRNDFINLISFLRKDDDLLKIEAFIQASLGAIMVNAPLPKSPDSEKVKPYIDNNDYSPNGLDQSFDEWCKAITHYFSVLRKQFEDKQQFEDIIFNMLYNLYVEPSVSLSIMGARLNLIEKYGTDDNLDIFQKEQLFKGE